MSEDVPRSRPTPVLSEESDAARGVMDSLSSQIAVLDQGGTILSTNRSWEQFTVDGGATPSARNGKGANYLEVCDSAAAGGDHLARFAAEGIRGVLMGERALYELEYPCDTPARKRWFILRATPLNSGVARAVVSHDEISERKGMEDQARVTRDFYLTLLEDFPFPIWRSNREGQRDYFNRTWLMFRGAGLPEEREAGWLSGIHEQDRTIYLDTVRQASDLRQPFQATYRLCHADGKHRWMAERGTPFRQVDGSFGGYLGAAQDITEQHSSEAALRVALREKESLLREVHHRVKNNLQVISSLLNLQLNRVEDRMVHAALQESKNRIRCMAQIHEQLYRSPSLSSIELGSYVRALVENIVRSSTVAHGALRVDIRIENISFGIDTAIPLGLIINELVTNAVKYAFPDGREGTITITVEPRRGREYVLRVMDDGIGLPEEVDIAKTGTLGLSLVHSLVDQLDGTMEVSRGGGTSFHTIFRELEYA